jgi:hypothetical protein
MTDAAALKLFSRPRTRGASSCPTVIKTREELAGMKKWKPVLISNAAATSAGNP